MRDNLAILKFVLFSWIFLLSACGGGGGSGSGGNLNLSGIILFDHAAGGFYPDHYGIMLYDLDNNNMRTFIPGKYAQKHTAAGITAFLQHCYRLPSDGPIYRVAYANSQGLITPVSACSDTIPNSTTNSGTPGISDFIEVSLSLDETKIAATVEYLNNNIQWIQFVQVYDLNGNVLKTYDNAYNATWLPDGRLLYVYSNHFYVTDTQLNSPTIIDDGGQINAPVHHPAIHPSGEFMIFEYNQQLWRMNIDGTELSEVLYSSRKLRWPTWSPDGKILLYTSWDSGNYYSDEHFYFFNIETLEQDNVYIGDYLAALADPWGPYNWY